VTASPTIPIESFPESPDDLWVLAHLFNCDWGSQVTNTEAFQTSVQRGISASEHRYGLMGKPIHSTTATLNASTRSQVRSLRMLLQRAGKARSLFPLFSDASRLEEAADASDTTILIDARHRRFFEGRRIAIVRDTADMQAKVFEVHEIESIDTPSEGEPHEISLARTGGLEHSYAAGSYVIPLIEARVLTEASGRVWTDRVVSLTLTAIEHTGSHQLELIEHDREWNEYQGLPIFDLIPNFEGSIQWGGSRLHQTTDSGIDAIGEYFGFKMRDTNRLPMRAMNRRQAWDIIGFFENQRGRQKTFWMPSPLDEFEPIAVTGGGASIIVKAAGPEIDWEFTKHLAVTTADGVVVREIQSVVRNVDEDTVTFTESIAGLQLSDIHRLGTAFRCRLNSDEISEQWRSNTVMDCVLDVEEVLEEKEVEISHLGSLETSNMESGSCPVESFYFLELCCCHVNCGHPWEALAGEISHDCEGDPPRGPVAGQIRGSLLQILNILPGEIDGSECIPPNNQEDFNIIRDANGWCWKVLCISEGRIDSLVLVESVDRQMPGCISGDPDDFDVCCCDRGAEITICAPGGCGSDFSSATTTCNAQTSPGSGCEAFQGFGRFQAGINPDPPFFTCEAEFVPDSSTGIPSCANRQSECRDYVIQTCCFPFIEYEESYTEHWFCCQKDLPDQFCPITTFEAGEPCCTSVNDAGEANCEIIKLEHCPPPLPY
jgi:hypothetical protein